MNFEVTKELDGKAAREYSSLVSNSGDSTFYHSLKYLKLLASFLEANPAIILCSKDGRLVGAMPTFIKRNRKFGTVLNSLPFYGSYGGVVARKDLETTEAGEVFTSVLSYLVHELCREEDVTLATIITWPYARELARYRQVLTPQYQDQRTAQMVILPNRATEDQFLQTFESRCRRSIKKAVDSRLTVRVLDSFETSIVDQLYEIHVENMQKIEAPSKPKLFFQNVDRFFEIHKDYDVYVAEHDDEVAGALLIFYFGDVVEYFIPGVRVQLRDLNPMNLILLKAMTGATRRGMRIWNFGGTRKEMTGIHMFKAGFGARDYSYCCHTRALSDVSRLLELTPANMRETYEWFYVVPYNTLAR